MSWTGLNWTGQHPRLVVDLTGDGKADIVGFGDDGMWTAIGAGDGSFQPPQLVSDFGGVNSGWRVDQHPRFVVDLTGDGKADIVGFGDDGVWTAIGTGDGTFQPAQFVAAELGVNSGWRVDQHRRFVVDLTGDGKADIVGFGDDGVWTAIGTGDGTFQPAQFVAAELGVNSGWRVDQHPRFVVDLTGDGKADIVGFGDDGVWTAIGTGDGTFQPAQFVAAELGVNSGWRTDLHPRFVVDLTGDGKADIVGFGDDGVWTAIGTGDGTLQRPRFVLADLGADSAKTGFPGSLSFAPRTHRDVITIAAGEERLYRLPPVSRGTVTVKAFHADVSLSARTVSVPVPQLRVAEDAVHPTLRSVAAATARDDTGDDGPHTDKSPARNLELELRLGTSTMARHGNLAVSESPNHNDGWRLHIRRPQLLDDLTPNPSQYEIETSYTSQLPILQRRVPAQFFHEGFELNWNKQQYVSGHINDSKLFIYFREDLRQLYTLGEDPVIDTGVPLAKANDIHTTGVTLGVGAGPAPMGGGMAPFFSVRVDCAGDGEIELPLLPDVTLPSFHVTVRLFLCRSGGSLEYRPVVESELLDLLADVEIPDPELPNVLNTVNARDTAKKAIEANIYQLQFPATSGFSRFGAAIAPWLVGERRQVWSSGYVPGESDTIGANGLIEPAAGDLLLEYVGRRPKPGTKPVGAHPNPDRPVAAPVDDGSIRLYDLPDEEPDPEPETPGREPPGGGGAVPRPSIGDLAKIDHIVVLMMENRSFDQVLGYLSRELGRDDVDGLNDLPPDPSVNPQFNRFNNRNLFPERATSTAWPVFKGPSGNYVGGPCHETECVLNQIDGDRPGKMERFVSDFAHRAGNNLEMLRLVMDYFSADQLPVYAVLAREFGICDQWYTSHAGPTWPNRFVLFTGDLNLDPLGNVEQDNPDFTTMVPLLTPTLFDHLNDLDVSWKVFENGYSFIRLFREYTFETTNVVWFDDPVRGFEAAARAGVLPQVTMIEPDYIDMPPGNDDHPPADMAHGQDFVNRIVQALIAGPQWDTTLLMITYDEHGGFYDHEKPPTDAPALRGGRTTLGPRVPTFLVSPWIKRQDVIHSRFDHTSIGATILRRFAGLTPPPSISARLDAALDVRDALSLTAPRPRSELASIGLPPLSARRPLERRSIGARSAPIGEADGNADFHWLLSALRLIGGEAPR